jgi:hypothetical protein
MVAVLGHSDAAAMARGKACAVVVVVVVVAGKRDANLRYGSAHRYSPAEAHTCVSLQLGGSRRLLVELVVLPVALSISAGNFGRMWRALPPPRVSLCRAGRPRDASVGWDCVCPRCALVCLCPASPGLCSGLGVRASHRRLSPYFFDVGATAPHCAVRPRPWGCVTRREGDVAASACIALRPECEVAAVAERRT